jgi:DNA-binding LacI/PurR family transcriptional regulator
MATITNSGPKYHQLATILRHRIHAGELLPGDRLPSFFEMRTQFGATQRTTEQVHHLLEADGLIVRQNGRGVFVTERPSRTRTGMIGCAGGAFSEQPDYYWMRIMRGMQKGARSHNRQLLLIDYPDQWSSFEKVDGILYSGSLDKILPHLPPGLPCVSLLHAHEKVPSVVMDETRAGELAAEHLLALGHVRIAMLSIAQDALATQREAGYLRALQQAGVKFDSRWLRRLFLEAKPSFEEQSAISMQQWLRDNWFDIRPTAIIVFNDHLAIGAVRELERSGLKVPQDISVVGFDSTELCDFFTPTLTSVEVPLQQIGARGVELLLAQIEEDENAPHSIVLPPSLQTRASSAAVGD